MRDKRIFSFVFILFGITQWLLSETTSVHLRHTNQHSEIIVLKDSLSKLSLSEERLILNKKVGVFYHQISDFDSAVHYYDKSYDDAVDLEFAHYQSSLLYNMSLVYRIKGNYQIALDCAFEAHRIDESLNDTSSITASLNSIALIYQEWGMYEDALEYRLKAIKLSIHSGNRLEIANSTYNLGALYSKFGKQENAKEYFVESQFAFNALLKDEPDNISAKLGLSESIYSIADILMDENQHDRAIEEFEKALELKTRIGDKVGIANCYYRLGVLKLLQGQFIEAKQNLFDALTYQNQIGDKKGIALVNYQIANLYKTQGRLKEAEVFVYRSIPVAAEIGDKEILRENYFLLYTIAEAKKQTDKALEYHILYKAYVDSILNENTTKIVEELHIQYETEKKEQENALLQQENEISQLTIEKQKTMERFLFGIIALVLIILVILYYLFHIKQKSNKLILHKNHLLEVGNTKIANQKKVIERKNRDMTDSIVYARRIQESMLTNVAKLNALLNEAFIYFKPKDIVSGDFYWFGEKDGKIIISAIDCTGHGVPGAFMSMLGNTFLNQIVLNMGITSPKDILLELSKEVQIALKQEETKNRDGMDMALCTIDLENKLVEFAGAKNPLVLVKDGEVERIKGDKAPIGLSYGENTAFTNHQISLDSDAQFYMFSDGYADQFGGPENKKFMIKRFQKLLFENHDKPMAEQQEILSVKMNEWMGEGEQIDDILVVGFKLSV